MVKRSPSSQVRMARWVLSKSISGAMAAREASISAGWR